MKTQKVEDSILGKFKGRTSPKIAIKKYKKNLGNPGKTIRFLELEAKEDFKVFK